MDPLAPFLFILMAKELSDLVSRVMEFGLYSRFKGFFNFMVSCLECEDDTLTLEVYSIGNLCNIKAILRHFELTSGLQVNFFKVNLIVLICTMLFWTQRAISSTVGMNPSRLST